jgi:hypothetical protein
MIAKQDEQTPPMDMAARTSAVKVKMHECLEELDRLGHAIAAAHLQMSIDSLAPSDPSTGEAAS